MKHNVTSVMMPFPPEIDINANPTGNHDKLTGSAATFYNMIIDRIGLNVTLVPVKSLGRCRYHHHDGNTSTTTTSCDGAAGLLYTGDADFSLLPMSLTCYDHRINQMPVKFGPKLFDSDMTFTTRPYESSHSSLITVMYSLNQDTTVNITCLFAILIMILSLFMINWSIHGKKFLNRIPMIQMVAMIFMKPTGRSVNALHRRLMYLCCLIITFMNYQLFLGSTKTDMVITEPAKYYESVHEVAISNASVTLLAGLTLDEDFESSSNVDKQIIFNRSIDRSMRFASNPNSENPFTAVAKEISRINTVCFFDSKAAAVAVLGINCFFNEFTPPPQLQMSHESFGTTAGVVTYSRFIDAVLRRHISHFYQILIESGIYDRYNNDVTDTLAPLGNIEKIKLCISKAFRKSESDSLVKPWTIHYFMDLFIIHVMIVIVAAVGLMAELFLHRIKGQNATPNAPDRRQRTKSIRFLH